MEASTTLVSPSQAGLPLMPGYFHQPSPGHPMSKNEQHLADRLPSVEILSIAKLSTLITSFFRYQDILAIVNSNCFRLPCHSEVDA